VLGRAHSPENPDWRILSAQGAALDQLGRFEEARQYYASALKIVPDEPAVLSTSDLPIGLPERPVVMVTGGFIGMVMAVQSYDQFRFMHLETNLGAVINVSLVKELGPVLAATKSPTRMGMFYAPNGTAMP
jgi:ABC-type transporter Mla maintaining outer membrane lipid asymmetry permease subunit MlaE